MTSKGCCKSLECLHSAVSAQQLLPLEARRGSMPVSQGLAGWGGGCAFDLLGLET